MEKVWADLKQTMVKQQTDRCYLVRQGFGRSSRLRVCFSPEKIQFVAGFKFVLVIISLNPLFSFSLSNNEPETAGFFSKIVQVIIEMCARCDWSRIGHILL